MIVYKATNKQTGESYIGQTSRTLEERKREHLRLNFEAESVFHNALYKYGWGNFEWTILCKCKSRLELNYKEKVYIQSFKKEGLYNVIHNDNTVHVERITEENTGYTEDLIEKEVKRKKEQKKEQEQIGTVQEVIGTIQSAMVEYEVDFDDETILNLARYAHSEDITINETVIMCIDYGIEQYKKDKDGYKKQLLEQVEESKWLKNKWT